MKKLFYLFSLTFLLLLSCSSNDNDTEPEAIVKDDVKPPFTIKYELLFSKEPRGSYAVEYTTDEKYGPRFYQHDIVYGKSKTWSKLITANRIDNPYQIKFSTDATFYEDTTVNFNIYISGILQSSSSYNRKSTGNDTDLYGIGTSIY